MGPAEAAAGAGDDGDSSIESNFTHRGPPSGSELWYVSAAGQADYSFHTWRLLSNAGVLVDMATVRADAKSC